MIFKTWHHCSHTLCDALSPALSAQIVDAAGRTVKDGSACKRVILGEAGGFTLSRPSKGDKTFDTIVGWRDDLIRKDPDSYTAYVERFPQIEILPRRLSAARRVQSGSRDCTLPGCDPLNLEPSRAQGKAVSKKGRPLPASRSSIDFRLDPDKNTERSIRPWTNFRCRAARRRIHGPIADLRSLW